MSRYICCATFVSRQFQTKKMSQDIPDAGYTLIIFHIPLQGVSLEDKMWNIPYAGYTLIIFHILSVLPDARIFTKIQTLRGKYGFFVFFKKIMDIIYKLQRFLSSLSWFINKCAVAPCYLPTSKEANSHVAMPKAKSKAAKVTSRERERENQVICSKFLQIFFSLEICKNFISFFQILFIIYLEFNENFVES